MPLSRFLDPAKDARNAILPPAGDQAGQESCASPVESLRNPCPSAFTRHTDEQLRTYLFPQYESKTSARPFGAQLASVAESRRFLNNTLTRPCGVVIQRLSC